MVLAGWLSLVSPFQAVTQGSRILHFAGLLPPGHQSLQLDPWCHLTSQQAGREREKQEEGEGEEVEKDEDKDKEKKRGFLRIFYSQTCKYITFPTFHWPELRPWPTYMQGGGEIPFSCVLGVQ